MQGASVVWVQVLCFLIVALPGTVLGQDAEQSSPAVPVTTDEDFLLDEGPREVFWRETATDKIKIFVRDDKVVKRWVFKKKAATRLMASQALLAPGETFPNSIGMDLVWIPTGSFVIGSPPDEPGRLKSEEPQHVVTFARGFWMSAFEITQIQYERIMGENPSQFRGSDLPVQRVSWRDANSFCRKLSARERATLRLPPGYSYLLPLEAQWEYACRAGSTGSRYQGPLDVVAWCSENSSKAVQRVGQLQPNEWDLFDMLGNVSEWCRDSWQANYISLSTPEDRQLRVIRGGSYVDGADNCRSAHRTKAGTHFKDASSAIGFRVVIVGGH